RTRLSLPSFVYVTASTATYALSLHDALPIFVEEPLVEHPQGVVQQLLRAGPAGGGGGGGGEHHEGVGVGLLGVVHRLAAGDRGEPAAVLVVVEDAAQRGEPVVDELPEARAAQQVAEREAVRHPARDPQLGGAREIGGAVLVDPGEAAVLALRRGPELEQLVTLALEPAAVGGTLQPGHMGCGSRGGGGGALLLLQLEGAGGLLGLGSGGAGLGHEQHLSVELELLDRLADVRECAMTAVLGGDVV